MKTVEEVAALGWLPESEAPTGVQVRVAHIGDPFGFRENDFCPTHGVRDESGHWQCSAGFTIVTGRRSSAFTFAPTHFKPMG